MEKQNAGYNAPTAFKNLKTKIPHKSDKVNIERAETEEHYADKQNAENTVLTTLKTIKNKTDEVIGRDKSEELLVECRTLEVLPSPPPRTTTLV